MKIRNFRWWVAGLIAFATALNYLDRQNLPVVISELKKSIPLDSGQYGMINSIFLFAYGTMYAVGGRLIDKLGSKKGLALMTAWWSVSNILHGFVSSVFGLGLARFLLGLGEGGGFPGSAKVVSEWFPAKERSFAFGIFNTGSSIGALVAPPLIAFVMMMSNWRWAFFVCGSLGLVWLVCWLRLYSTPAESKFLHQDERNFIEAGIYKDAGKDRLQDDHITWGELFSYRKVWGLLLIKFFTDAGWFFFIFWLPKYLNDVRGLDIKGIGAYAWIPYAAAGLGSLSGGWFSSFLVKRNVSIDIARKIPLAISAAMLPASLLITNASLGFALVFFCIAMFGHQCWATIVQTLPADMFPSRVIGSIAGLMGCIGTYGAMLFSLVIGFVIEWYGYKPAFIAAGVLHPLSFLIILLIIKKVELIKRVPARMKLKPFTAS
jgi:ACS family hexuronate transporter-like MFS transporter